MLTREWMARVVVALALLLTVVPASAQESPDSSSAAAVADQSDDSGGTTSDQSPPSSADATPPAAVDPQAVVAQWGPAPTMGADADQAVARRWFQDQNTKRARWGVPTANRDPYLDWEAQNALRAYLNQPALPLPNGLSKPSAAAQSPQSDRAVHVEPQFWTVSDSLWQAWLNTFEARIPLDWQLERPDEPFFTREAYLQVQEWRRQRFDRYRLLGVAGSVVNNQQPQVLPESDKTQLEQIAPGSVAAYQPQEYENSLVAVVGYDPWINQDGSLRP